VKHAIQNIEKNGGSVKDGILTIAAQQPVPVKFEKNFDGHFPLAKLPLALSPDNEFNFEFDGIGFVMKGETAKWGSEKETFIFATELYIDGKLVEKPTLPANYTTRRYDLAWKYQLPKGKHTVKLKITNPSTECKILYAEAIVYTDKPVDGMALTINAAK
jgi:hypothetical protein